MLQSPAMSALQIFKAVLRGLASVKPLANGCCMKREAGSSAKKPPSLGAFKAAFEISLIDPSGWLNVAAHVSKASLRQVSFSQDPVGFGESTGRLSLPLRVLAHPTVGLKEVDCIDPTILCSVLLAGKELLLICCTLCDLYTTAAEIMSAKLV